MVWFRRDFIKRLAGVSLVAAPSAAAFGKAVTPADNSEALEKKIQRAIDALEIQNLMSVYAYYHLAGMSEDEVGLFARKTPGVKLQHNRGIYDGIEGVRKFIVGTAKVDGTLESHVGQMHLHAATTPVIQVAGDGKTAQGLWISPGAEAIPPRSLESVGLTAWSKNINLEQGLAVWAWIKWGVDFVKEDGQWRFWHFRMYHIFTAPPGKSWQEVPATAQFTAPNADRPSDYYAGYSPTTAVGNVPPPPTPYETWDDSRAFIK